MEERGETAFSLDGDIHRRATQEERVIVKGKMMMNWVLGKVIVPPSSQAKQGHVLHYYVHAVTAHLVIM